MVFLGVYIEIVVNLDSKWCSNVKNKNEHGCAGGENGPRISLLLDY